MLDKSSFTEAILADSKQPISDVCISLVDCIHDFQTLIAAIIALLSAFGVGWVALHAARLPVQAKDRRIKEEIERRRQFSCRLLSQEFMRICELARQAEGTINVVIGSNTDVTDNTRAKTTIIEPPFLDDWETMSLLSNRTLSEVMGVRATLRRHNFDMQRAGGSFGDTNFRSHILRQVKQLRNSAQQVATHLKNEGLHGPKED